MNTRLYIQVRQPFADGSIQTAAVAKVRRLTDAEDQLVKRWWQKEKPVGIEGGNSQNERFTEFELPGGGYYRVTIILPRGDGIDREFDVQEGNIHRELIEMDVSQHENLGWQQYAGIVRAKPCRSRVVVSSMGVESTHETTLMEKEMRRMAHIREEVPQELPSVSRVLLWDDEADWERLGRVTWILISRSMLWIGQDKATPST